MKRKQHASQSQHGFENGLGLIAAVLLTVASASAADNAPAKSSPNGPHPEGPQSIPAPDPAAVQVPKGYRVEIAIKDLSFPTSVEIDDSGHLFIAEAGAVPGYKQSKPRVLRVMGKGAQETFIEQGLEAPVNDLLWHNGKLYVSHRGKISVVEDGRLRDLVTGLPSLGDHQNNQITAGPDGKLYFGQGTATNSGVVGPDNYKMGWLKKHPDFHDAVAKPLSEQAKLRDQVFASKNPLTDFKGDTRITSAFAPFSEVHGDKPLQGTIKANGTILRMDPDGSNLEIYAYGLRNPVGVLWGVDDRLYATENGFDVRGSRPIADDWDDLYLVKKDRFYGWPDFASGVPVTDPRFKPMKKGAKQPKFLMQNHPPVEEPLHQFPKHSAIAKLDASPGGEFGHQGELFIAFFGHWTPMTGKAPKPHGGHRVVRYNPRGGAVVEVFSRKPHGHSGSSASKTSSSKPKSNEKNAKSSGGHQMSPGPRRPIDVRFAPDGSAMYVVDFGVQQVHPGGEIKAYPKTGLVWKVTPAATGDP